MLNAAKNLNYEGKSTLIKVRSIEAFNRLFEPRRSRTSLNIIFGRPPPALERVIDCVTMTFKKGNSNHHLGAPQNQRYVFSYTAPSVWTLPYEIGSSNTLSFFKSSLKTCLSSSPTDCARVCVCTRARVCVCVTIW